MQTTVEWTAVGPARTPGVVEAMSQRQSACAHYSIIQTKVFIHHWPVIHCGMYVSFYHSLHHAFPYLFICSFIKANSEASVSLFQTFDQLLQQQAAGSSLKLLRQIRLDTLLFAHITLPTCTNKPSQPHEAYGILVNIFCLMIFFLHRFKKSQTYIWATFEQHSDISEFLSVLTAQQGPERWNTNSIMQTHRHGSTHICSSETSELRITTI